MKNIDRVIRRWALKTWEDQKYLKFDDLHVDDIDQRWSNPETWWDAGLTSIASLARVITERRIPLTPALAFTLVGGSQRVGCTFKTLDEFRVQWSNTPPSLCLFEPCQEAWIETPKARIPSSIITQQAPNLDWLYSEYMEPPDPDFRRIVWVVGKAATNE